jgi:hypothetical protein
MSRQCPFPVQFSDNRRCYRSGNAPGFTLALLLVALLAGYAGHGHAAPAAPAAVTSVAG